MAATELPRNPLQYATKFVGTSLVSALSITVLTSPVLALIYSLENSELTLPVVIIVSFAILVSHDHLISQKSPPEISNNKQLIMICLGLVHYNLTLLLGWVVSVQITEVSYVAAVFFTVLLPFWERVSIKHAIPASIGGILVWALAIAYMTLELGSKAINAASRADFRSTALSAAACLEFSENWFISHERFRGLN